MLRINAPEPSQAPHGGKLSRSESTDRLVFGAEATLLDTIEIDFDAGVMGERPARGIEVGPILIRALALGRGAPGCVFLSTECHFWAGTEQRARQRLQ